MIQFDEGTIVALSTPVGTGGVAVIRMTGPQAFEIADKVFVSAFGKKLSKAESHKALYGWIVEPSNQNPQVCDPQVCDPQVCGEKIDEVLALVMRAPRTFTGEDTVEINCHGGMYICNRIIQALIAAGAQMAEPGEFSKRAFLNGRMDLTKAEAVMDMISAQTSYSLKAAVNQLGGNLADKIDQLRSKLIDTIVSMEVNIDYPEYDVPEISDEEVHENCLAVREEVQKLLSTAESGRMLRQGVKVAIVGKPNVGKSSLLNMLLREQRAIVTSIPGTTRDVLEETLDLGGIPIRIMDTAGIRETEDIVEKIGVERAFASIEESDLALFVLDATRDIEPEELELFERVKNRQYLVVLNKTDAGWQSQESVLTTLLGTDENADAAVGRKELMANLKERFLEISAKEQQGMEALTEQIKRLFFGGDILVSDRPMVANMRQKQALMRADEALARVIDGYGFEQDLLIIDIRQACDFLGEVSGRSTQEDVIGEIFSRFCLGK